MAVGSLDGLDEQLLNELVAQGSLDFDDWTKFLASVEHLYPDDMDKISLVYDAFLSEFPLCYGYWKKYAELMARLCSMEDAVRVFERAVESVPYSVGVWVDYCSFGIASFEDPLDVRRLFERGLSFVGKDYLCHNLWDKYIEFEYSNEHWNSLASIYIQTLKFPTKKLHQYYESFKKLVAIWKEDMKFQGSSRKEEQQPEHDTDNEIVASEGAEISHVINDLIDESTRPKALQKYISTGELFYQRACDLDAKVHKFEQNIHRPFFHVKPLDDDQLHNWHHYLDQVEMEGDFDWALKLYERCLISCAHYPEFWMRYVDYVESKGGREIATDALGRATQIFLKNVPEIHLFNAWFKEKIGDVDGTLAAFPKCDEDNESFIDTVRRKANMERRMGHYSTASSVYKEAIDLAAKKRPDILPMLYVHFARLQYMVTDNEDAAREVLLNGIKHVPQSKLLLKELILYSLMHDGARQVDLLDPIVAQVLALGTDVSGCLSIKDREDISRLYLEFVDCCGSINDVRRAWNRHLKFFPHLVRVQSSLKKPAKAGAIWKMVIEGRPDSLSSYPPKSPKELDKNRLIQLPPPEIVLVSENIDKSEQAICEQTQFENGNRNQNVLNLVTSEDTKTFVKDERKSNYSGLGHQAVNDRNPEEVVKNSKLYGIQEEQEQDRRSQQQNPDSLEVLSLNPQDDEYHNKIASPSQGLEAPREGSLSIKSTPVGGLDIDESPSTSSPVKTNSAEAYNEPPCSSRMKRKDPSSIVSPDRPSGKEGNQNQSNSSGKGCLRHGSPGDSRERLERSLSPRRRDSHGYLNDRRHRERSLSPRRHNSRWNSDERWHRDRRHRRYPRFQDNSRGHRDGRMQNQSIVVIGNKEQTQTVQQKSTGFASQTQLPVQPIAYPQPQTNQLMLINEQYGNVQNNQSFNQMWQYYYYNQPQLLLQQSLGSQQQLQQMQPPQQLQQHMQPPQQPQQTLPHQQHLPPLQYQQQQLYQQLNFQQQQNNEQPQSQQQQVQFQQQTQLPQEHVILQQQSQKQDEHQQLVHIQQQQSYQYQQAQQQQYLLYLQQLHQYQQSQQQPGLALDQKSFVQQPKLPEEEQRELPEVLYMNEKSQFLQDDASAQVASISSTQQQDQVIEHVHGSTAGVQSQEELPEIEGTDI